MSIRLTTLGGLRVTLDGVELDRLLGQRSRVALLVYLAVERRISRESLLTVFWPESDAEAARHALRQSLYRLRRTLGEDWIEAHGDELRVDDRVLADVHALSDALDRGHPESAARLYGGPFLDGVHLVDLGSWENWVDARRTQCARAFRTACRAWVRERREAGDLEGAVEAAEHWVAPDPLDDEAQHELVRALAEAGEQVEAVRQYEAYARALERDGLEPLDQTLALVERLRGQEGARPELPEPAVAPGPVPRTAASPRPPRSPPYRPLPRRLLFGGALLVVLAVVAAIQVGGGRIDAVSLVEGDAPGSAGRIVLADFGSAAPDPLLGAVVTDALRIDLLESPVLRLVERGQVRETLGRMHVEGDPLLTADLALEVALREGAKAVLEGDVASVGTGYILTATIRAAGSGASLAAFRETAEGDHELLGAIDRLSRRIRSRAGESLQSVEATPPLSRVTTSSLEALRLLSRADRAFDRADYERAASLLEEAVEVDPDFAMAWRRLAVALGNMEVNRVRELEAATRAYELRHLLSPRERHLAAARYHGWVNRDSDGMIEAYRRVLEIDPHDRVALTNLGGAYLARQDYDAAEAILRRGVEGSAVAFMNLIEVLIAKGELEEAGRAVEAFASRYPDNREVPFRGFWVFLLKGDAEGARAQLDPLMENPSLPANVRARAHDHAARLALQHGRMAEAREHLAEAERIGQEVGDSFLLVRRLFTAHAEVAVGDPARGLRLLTEGTGDGILKSLAPADRWHFLRAIIFAMASRPDEAEAVLRSFHADVPPEFHDQFLVRNESAQALVLLQRGEHDASVRLLEEIRADRRCWACYAERMGWALREAGRLEEAAEEWERALALKDFTHSIEWQFTQNLWTLQRLPSLYEEMGDTARAVAQYRRLIELWRDADPELQPRVRHARERVAALERR